MQLDLEMDSKNEYIKEINLSKQIFLSLLSKKN